MIPLRIQSPQDLRECIAEGTITFKYVRLSDNALRFEAVHIWGLDHASLVGLDEQPISAGFVVFGWDGDGWNGKVDVKSEISMSLKLGPKEDDQQLIKAYLNE